MPGIVARLGDTSRSSTAYHLPRAVLPTPKTCVCSVALTTSIVRAKRSALSTLRESALHVAPIRGQTFRRDRAVEREIMGGASPERARK